MFFGIVPALAVATDIASAAGKVYVAQDAGATTPLPPERPATLAPAGAPPATPPTQSMAPSGTATPAPAPPAAQQAPNEPIYAGVVNNGPGTLLKLPPASHARMHQCAAEWQNMKLTGATKEKTWFDFARHCLTR